MGIAIIRQQHWLQLPGTNCHFFSLVVFIFSGP